MAMEKGRELQGKYMILRQLGEGGEGNTYLAYDEQANRNVAVRECGEKPSESRLAAWQKMRRAKTVWNIWKVIRRAWMRRRQCA